MFVGSRPIPSFQVECGAVLSRDVHGTVVRSQPVLYPDGPSKDDLHFKYCTSSESRPAAAKNCNRISDGCTRNPSAACTKTTDPLPSYATSSTEMCEKSSDGEQSQLVDWGSSNLLPQVAYDGCSESIRELDCYERVGHGFRNDKVIYSLDSEITISRGVAAEFESREASMISDGLDAHFERVRRRSRCTLESKESLMGDSSKEMNFNGAKMGLVKSNENISLATFVCLNDSEGKKQGSPYCNTTLKPSAFSCWDSPSYGSEQHSDGLRLIPSNILLGSATRSNHTPVGSPGAVTPESVRITPSVPPCSSSSKRFQMANGIPSCQTGEVGEEKSQIVDQHPQSTAGGRSSISSFSTVAQALPLISTQPALGEGNYAPMVCNGTELSDFYDPKPSNVSPEVDSSVTLQKAVVAQSKISSRCNDSISSEIQRSCYDALPHVQLSRAKYDNMSTPLGDLPTVSDSILSDYDQETTALTGGCADSNNIHDMYKVTSRVPQQSRRCVLCGNNGHNRTNAFTCCRRSCQRLFCVKCINLSRLKTGVSVFSEYTNECIVCTYQSRKRGTADPSEWHCAFKDSGDGHFVRMLRDMLPVATGLFIEISRTRQPCWRRKVGNRARKHFSFRFYGGIFESRLEALELGWIRVDKGYSGKDTVGSLSSRREISPRSDTLLSSPSLQYYSIPVSSSSEPHNAYTLPADTLYEQTTTDTGTSSVCLRTFSEAGRRRICHDSPQHEFNALSDHDHVSKRRRCRCNRQECHITGVSQSSSDFTGNRVVHREACYLVSPTTTEGAVTTCWPASGCISTRSNWEWECRDAEQLYVATDYLPPQHTASCHGKTAYIHR